MDYKSIKSFEGCSVKITLLNDYWWRAKIIDVSEHSVKFLEEHGREVCVTPENIVMILPMKTELKVKNE